MSSIGQTERATQNRVIALFTDALHYTYLGNRKDRADNSNIEEGALSDYLARRSCSPALVTKAMHALRTAADNPSRNLYANKQAVYQLLRYGVQVKAAVGEQFEIGRAHV